jgi:hypothetical protein
MIRFRLLNLRTDYPCLPHFGGFVRKTEYRTDYPCLPHGDSLVTQAALSEKRNIIMNS